MEPTPDKTRLRKIAEVQRKLGQGLYDNAAELDRMLDDVLAATGPDSLVDDLRACPLGDGHRYRDLVHQAMQRGLNRYVDEELTRVEGAAGGGRIDIELPLRYAALRNEPLFVDWGKKYKLKSLIVECKNQKSRASLTDYRQLRDYLDTAGMGRVGILVARRGFAKTVRQRVSEDARRGESLVLLMDGDDLVEFAAVASRDAPEWFHRKEIRTLQAA